MKNFIALTISVLLILLLMLGYSTNVNSELSQDIVRLHVIANSDSEADQALKLKVRDAILENTKECCTQKEDIANNIELYQKIARDTVCENGFSYDVRVEYGNFNFPTKNYGNVSLPAGSYDALRIKIGEAKGKNWWCVMFPPLCFVDGTTNSAFAEKSLRETFGDDNYDLVTAARNGKFPFEIKFKIVELCGRLTKNEKVYASAGKD